MSKEQDPRVIDDLVCGHEETTPGGTVYICINNPHADRWNKDDHYMIRRWLDPQHLGAI